MYWEGFTNQSSSSSSVSVPTTVLVFVSKSCGHCVNYNANVHDKVQKYAKSKGIKLERIFADDDKSNLFEKYNIQYVPDCVIIKGDKTKQVSGSITPESISSTISSM
jgi:thiol-disulfide isomerase/thioredoxin